MASDDNLRVRAYRPGDAARWDDFLPQAYMATFLHTRRFLSYHRDRFVDRSLLLQRGDKLLGLLPAAQSPQHADLVVSHPGITYGGLLHTGELRGAAMIEAMQTVAAFYRELGYRRLRYKAVPSVYHRAPAQDDLYALFRAGALRSRCDLSSSIDLQHRLPPSSRRKRALSKAERAGADLSERAEHLPAFWSVLSKALASRHAANPTHSLAEMQELVRLFPGEIRFVFALLHDRVEAGVVLFCTPRVRHAQYIASSVLGRELNLLDLVFARCLEDSQREDVRYFDFGISTESEGRMLNAGLNGFKNEFGAGGVVHEFYDLDLSVESA
jgi:hypothetical protein